jgi:hypothetical protein
MQQTYLAKHSSVDVFPHFFFSQGSMHFLSLFLHFWTHGSDSLSSVHVGDIRPTASIGVIGVTA